MADFDFKVSDQLRENLAMAVRDYPEEAASALFAEALAIEKESRRRTPVMTGALRGSHKTEKPTRKFGGVEVSIGVGGPAAPYAVHVHYRDELKHQTGQSRFLESAVNDASNGLAERLADRIKKKIEGKVR